MPRKGIIYSNCQEDWPVDSSFWRFKHCRKKAEYIICSGQEEGKLVCEEHAKHKNVLPITTQPTASNNELKATDAL